MRSILKVYRDQPCDGPTNMARDECLLHDPDTAPAALRLYTWSEPTLSLGYFQPIAARAAQDPAVQALPVVRRPTGGGAILHDQEITYCLVVAPPLPITAQAPLVLYELVHAAWRDVLVQAGIPVASAPEDFPLPSPRSGPFFCFEKPGRTDLIVGQQKLLGSAQRRIPPGLAPRVPAAGRVLQHGSLLLAQRFAAHPGHNLALPLYSERTEQWIAQFIFQLAARLDLEPVPATWSAAQLEDAAERAERYAGDAWTARR